MKDISVDLNLKPTKIYKWFWDHKKKMEGVKTELKIIDDIDGQTGNGDKLSAVQIKSALKINKNSYEREDEPEVLALEMGIPINEMANEIFRMHSPTGRRQIIQKSTNKNITSSFISEEDCKPP